MSGKRFSETALSTSVPSRMTAKKRKEGHCDPLGGPPTITYWFEIPEVVEKVLSSLKAPLDIERAAMVNKCFQKCSCRATKDLYFRLHSTRVYGPFPGFSKYWKPSDMADHIPIIWKKCCNLRNLEVRGHHVSRKCDDFLFSILKLQRNMKRKFECLTFRDGALLSPVFPPLIELCSDTLTQLQLNWCVPSDSNEFHPAVGLIAHAIRLCRSLRWFESDGSPDGIGKILMELSDKVKLELLCRSPGMPG